MVKTPYIDSNGIQRGACIKEEDEKLKAFVLRFGPKNWPLVAKYSGLSRCPKSCRLRWVNYLNPDITRRRFTEHERDRIIELHRLHGTKWSTIASYFPGRNDNDIKNYYNGHIKRRMRSKDAKVMKALTLHDESISSINTSDDFKTLSNDHLITESFNSKNFSSSTSSMMGSYDSATSYNDYYSFDLRTESLDDADNNFDFGISPLERGRMMNSTDEFEESFWSDIIEFGNLI